MKRRFLLLAYLLIAITSLHADMKVKDVDVKPRWPWNGLVDITYSIECDEKDEEGKPKDIYVDFTGIDNDRNITVKMKSLTGQGAKEPVKSGGPYTVTWNMGKDEPNLNSSSFQVDVHAIAGIAPYMVVNLETWKVRYTNQPPNLDDDTCRTTELWLRQIQPGTFTMGSPSNEVGDYGDDMVQHQVTITQMFYIGVFECTQRQWELVMGNKPSYFSNATCYATRPVECVSYDNIRGTTSTAGAGWPTYGHAVDSTSFMGKLQEKTGLTFDLPTEAQWEYACRAGTTTALNSGKNLTSIDQDAAMDEVGRYWHNGGSGYDSNGGENCIDTYGTAKVGSYLPNAWGLYDMHGNVYEWCLDWWGASTSSTAAVADPGGPSTGLDRVGRGGCWDSDASDCRSAYRYYEDPSSYNDYSGFRVLCLPKQNLYAVVDLSGGPDVTKYPVRYTDIPPNLNDDKCRTTELWLRQIQPGTFTMGCDSSEVGYYGFEFAKHQVTITQMFYIGVFECTQRQWELVMGNKPSYFNNATYYATRPVEKVSYNMIRGTGAQAGAGWPTYGHIVDATSFMGKLQEKTGMTFDLPTEAQWEYACRAGTTTALNSGKNLTSTSSDAAMNEVGRYRYNGGSGYSSNCAPTYGTAKVGSYLPNAWGLYDMHGNVWEWCLDWWGASSSSTAAVSDPVGPSTGSNRVKRGGSWYDDASDCRSANQFFINPSYYYFTDVGFRVLCLPLGR